MKPLLNIMRLNHERYGSDFEYTKAMEKLSEELSEFTEANANKDEHEMIDALNDIIVVAAGEITKLGYNPELTLKQCVKHIEVREQDPEQAKRWARNEKLPGEKWLKDVNQDPKTLHEANYQLCRNRRK